MPQAILSLHINSSSGPVNANLFSLAMILFYTCSLYANLTHRLGAIFECMLHSRLDTCSPTNLLSLSISNTAQEVCGVCVPFKTSLQYKIMANSSIYSLPSYLESQNNFWVQPGFWDSKDSKVLAELLREQNACLGLVTIPSQRPSLLEKYHLKYCIHT